MTEQTINQQSGQGAFRRWSAEEDARLIRHIKAYPHNLSRCFTMVAEETGRTKTAVAAHWYQSLSKKPEAFCFFTASASHLSKNRKNGMGEPAPTGFWRSLLSVLQRFHF